MKTKILIALGVLLAGSAVGYTYNSSISFEFICGKEHGYSINAQGKSLKASNNSNNTFTIDRKGNVLMNGLKGYTLINFHNSVELKDSTITIFMQSGTRYSTFVFDINTLKGGRHARALHTITDFGSFAYNSKEIIQQTYVADCKYKVY